MKKFSLQFMLLAFFLLFNHQLSAQKLTVESLEQITDVSASMFEYQMIDNNGNYASIVKVMIPKDGVRFDGGMLLDQKKWDMGEYWVWLAKGATKLIIRVPDQLPLEVNFRDYGLVVGSKNTYRLVVSDPSEMQSQLPVSGFTVSGVSFRMVHVEGGTFQMGATGKLADEADSNEKTVHSVSLRSYLIGETEVTQELWEAVMGSNPSRHKGEELMLDNVGKLPVENVSWDDCQQFIKKLNTLTGKVFRLPTEAEWEYAARGDNQSRGHKYSGSDKLDDVAWYSNFFMPMPVGEKQPNELGIYDMSGNVWEWCEDWFGAYDDSPQMNPKGSKQKICRVIRGGSYDDYAKDCRVSNRNCSQQDIPDGHLGLRLAM
ncbi:MAG: SUMF1/EgtB/PvdO family nonheme iron enzyme [Bacteroidaceae bacterium]|nr:SUMF1/EgtB/PvdO family nonheme iron enzyme [Bacteroidaceae bacterium]